MCLLGSAFILHDNSIITAQGKTCLFIFDLSLRGYLHGVFAHSKNTGCVLSNPVKASKQLCTGEDRGCGLGGFGWWWWCSDMLWCSNRDAHVWILPVFVSKIYKCAFPTCQDLLFSVFLNSDPFENFILKAQMSKTYWQCKSRPWKGVHSRTHANLPGRSSQRRGPSCSQACRDIRRLGMWVMMHFFFAVHSHRIVPLVAPPPMCIVTSVGV